MLAGKSTKQFLDELESYRQQKFRESLKQGGEAEVAQKYSNRVAMIEEERSKASQRIKEKEEEARRLLAMTDEQRERHQRLKEAERTLLKAERYNEEVARAKEEEERARRATVSIEEEENRRLQEQKEAAMQRQHAAAEGDAAAEREEVDFWAKSLESSMNQKRNALRAMDDIWKQGTEEAVQQAPESEAERMERQRVAEQAKREAKERALAAAETRERREILIQQQRAAAEIERQRQVSRNGSARIQANRTNRVLGTTQFTGTDGDDDDDDEIVYDDNEM